MDDIIKDMFEKDKTLQKALHEKLMKAIEKMDIDEIARQMTEHTIEHFDIDFYDFDVQEALNAVTVGMVEYVKGRFNDTRN